MKAVIAAVAVAALGLAACQPKPVAPQQDASAASSVAAPLSPDEQGLTTPEAFLRALYAHYTGDAADSTFSPLWAAPAYFDPEMLALMDEDERLAGDEIGALDADPICGCQDYNGITATITVTEQTATTARASARLGGQDAGKTLTYDLVKVDGNWRIHDIHSEAIPSLRQLFIRSNKELAAYAASMSASTAS